jgi:hypothetical protein
MTAAPRPGYVDGYVVRDCFAALAIPDLVAILRRDVAG